MTHRMHKTLHSQLYPGHCQINVLLHHNLFEALTTLTQLRNIIPDIGRILDNGTENPVLSPLYSYCIAFDSLMVISKPLHPHISMCRLFELFLIRGISFLARNHKCVFVIYCYYRPGIYIHRAFWIFCQCSYEFLSALLYIRVQYNNAKQTKEYSSLLFFLFSYLLRERKRLINNSPCFAEVLFIWAVDFRTRFQVIIHDNISHTCTNSNILYFCCKASRPQFSQL